MLTVMLTTDFSAFRKRAQCQTREGQIGALNLLPHGQDVESFPRALRGRQVGNFLVEPPEQPAQQSVGNTFDVCFILACTPKLAQLLEVPVE